MNSVGAKIGRRLARIMARKVIRMNNPKPIISFSFDDVPKSACRAGRAILEEKELRGTYYISGSFHERRQDDHVFHDSGDIAALIEGGHEIACHGFAHLDYQKQTAQEIDTDIHKNAEYFTDQGLDMAPVNFAYPFGCVNPMVKEQCGKIYTSARGVIPGIHAGKLDLGLLNSYPLFEPLWTPERIDDLIKETVRKNGWTIFFSHGVIDNPGDFDCSPAMLEHAVSSALENDCEILSVKHALGRIAFRPE